MTNQPGAEMRRTLIVTQSFPPRMGAMPNLLRSFVSRLPRDRFVVLHGVERPVDDVRPPDCIRLALPLRGLQYRFYYYPVLPLIAAAGCFLVWRHRLEQVVAVYPSRAFFIGAWLTARMTGRPLLLWMNDLWEESMEIGIEIRTAGVLEPRIFRAARKVLAYNEAILEHYAAKHGATGEVMERPVEREEAARLADAAASPVPAPEGPRPFRLVYTGGVYGINRDAVARLVRVVNAWKGPPLELVISSTSPPDALRAMGIDGPGVRTFQLRTHGEVYRLQREADALVMLLGFHPTMGMAEVTTALPSKIFEYVAAGAPILFHGPGGSYTARFCRERRCGTVVAEDSDDALRDGIAALMEDAALRARLAEESARLCDAYAPATIVPRLVRALS